MRPAIIGLLLVLARAAGADTIETHNVAGTPHQFTVPDGWSAHLKNGVVGFAPPMDKLHGPFLYTIKAEKGATDDPFAAVKKLGDADKAKRRAWATVGEPKPFTFV